MILSDELKIKQISTDILKDIKKHLDENVCTLDTIYGGYCPSVYVFNGKKNFIQGIML